MSGKVAHGALFIDGGHVFVGRAGRPSNLARSASPSPPRDADDHVCGRRKKDRSALTRRLRAELIPAAPVFLQEQAMPRLILRILAALGMAFGLYVNNAAAGVGAIGAEALSAFARLSPVQTVQAGECWNQNGPDGPGYYPCGDGGGGPIVGPSIGRPDRHGAGAVSASPGASPVTPGLAGVHGGNGATGGHVSAPASPGVAGSTAAATAVPHIAAPASPGAAAGAVGTPHIGAPASQGLAGVHGAVPAGGIGHR